MTEWWRNDEAVIRLEALWRSREHLHLDPGDGHVGVVRDHADRPQTTFSIDAIHEMPHARLFANAIGDEQRVLQAWGRESVTLESHGDAEVHAVIDGPSQSDCADIENCSLVRFCCVAGIDLDRPVGADELAVGTAGEHPSAESCALMPVADTAQLAAPDWRHPAMAAAGDAQIHALAEVDFELEGGGEHDALTHESSRPRGCCVR